MRMIAIQHFHPPGLARFIRPGEVLEVEDELARAWLNDGLALEARTIEPDQAAVLKPAETAVSAPAEKAVRKPRENAARKKR